MKEKKFARVFILFLVIYIAFSPLMSADAENTENNNTENTGESIHAFADSMRGTGDKEIWENTTIIKGDITIVSPEAEVYKDEWRVIFKKEVDVEYNRGTVKSKELTALLNDDQYIFEKEVVLKHNTEQDKIVDLKTSYLTMHSETNSFEAEQGVVIDYDGSKIEADKAQYDDQEQLLIVEGEVMIEESNGWMKCDTAYYYLDEEGGFEAVGSVESYFETEE